MKASLLLRRMDKRHNVIEERILPMRSWTRKFFEQWYTMAGHNSNTVAGTTDILSVARTLGATAHYYCNLLIASPPGSIFSPILTSQRASMSLLDDDSVPPGELVGIVVGSDNTAVTPADNKLGTQIAHGDAAGELIYGGCLVFPPVFAGANGSMEIQRYFENRSGGNVTVEEAGIYSPGFIVAGSAYIFCIAHDVTGGVVVADTEILEVTYTVQITV
jgi:hypothetical protein